VTRRISEQHKEERRQRLQSRINRQNERIAPEGAKGPISKDIMSEIQGFMLLGGAFWVTQSGEQAGYKYVNDLRDTVLMGKIGQNTIDIAHRYLIIENDYMSVFRGMLLTAVLYGSLMVMVGYSLANASRIFRCVSILFGIVMVGRALGTFMFMDIEINKMKAAIEADRCKLEADNIINQDLLAGQNPKPESLGLLSLPGRSSPLPPMSAPCPQQGRKPQAGLAPATAGTSLDTLAPTPGPRT
jgi:hypothetical protein